MNRRRKSELQQIVFAIKDQKKTDISVTTNKKNNMLIVQNHISQLTSEIILNVVSFCSLIEIYIR